MTRRWQPKYPVHCEECGWKSKRTRATMHYLCPRCYPGYRGRGHRRIRYAFTRPTVRRTPREPDQDAIRIIAAQEARIVAAEAEGES